MAAAKSARRQKPLIHQAARQGWTLRPPRPRSTGRASWSIWAISGFGAPVYTEACVGPASLVETAPGDRFRRGPSASRGARSLSGWRGSALPAWGCQQLLGDSLHRGRVDLALVGLHDVTDEPAHLLRVRDVERGQPLPDETPDR